MGVEDTEDGRAETPSPIVDTSNMLEDKTDTGLSAENHGNVSNCQNTTNSTHSSPSSDAIPNPTSSASSNIDDDLAPNSQEPSGEEVSSTPAPEPLNSNDDVDSDEETSAKKEDAPSVQLHAHPE